MQYKLKTMKATILLSYNYGFGKNWILLIKMKKDKTRRFWLGQDSKFCQRILGMYANDVIKAIGTRNIDEGTRGNRKLAKFIIEQLGLTEERIDKLEDWELACQ